MEIWQKLNEDSGGLNFPVLIASKQVTMRISTEALQDHFGAGDVGATIMSAYRKHSAIIDQKAVERHLVDPLSKVMLKTFDF